MMVLRNVVFLMSTLILLGGCASTKMARKVETHGFLDDYSILVEGKKGELPLTYHDPSVNWASYTKIMLDPVMIWIDSKDRDKGLPQQDLQSISGFFYNVLYQELSKDYEIVKEPGQGTLRLQVALTDVDKSHPMLSVVSSIPAPYNVLALGSLAKTLITGKPLFVGDVSCEGKATDARTGKLLGAIVTRRVGSRGMRSLSTKKFESWGDVEEALRYWAENLRYKLCMGRGAANCVSPEP